MTIVTISAEGWSDIWNREHLLQQGMVMLADPERRTIADYGLEDITLGEEVARPAAFLVDTSGVIRWRSLPDDWRARPSGPQYLEVVRAHVNGETP